MNNPAKTLKIISIIVLVLAIISLVVGVLSLAGGGLITGLSGSEEGAAVLNEAVDTDAEMADNLNELNDTYGTDLSGSDIGVISGVTVLVLGIMLIIEGIWGIVLFALGNKAAKGGSANGAFIVGVIACILAIISVITAISNGSGVIGAVVTLVFYGLYTYSAKQLKDNGNTAA